MTVPLYTHKLCSIKLSTTNTYRHILF